ncbi:hypothetical protein GCM10027610_046870 [Dactylosporangium cerinum]
MTLRGAVGPFGEGGEVDVVVDLDRHAGRRGEVVDEPAAAPAGHVDVVDDPVPGSNAPATASWTWATGSRPTPASAHSASRVPVTAVTGSVRVKSIGTASLARWTPRRSCSDAVSAGAPSRTDMATA